MAGTAQAVHLHSVLASYMAAAYMVAAALADPYTAAAAYMVDLAS